MPIRNQPYLPLYVQDFQTDEKLIECSAQATGVYIRLMCLLHKSEQYGKILLKQKYKQSTDQILNFASQVAKNFPYDFAVVESSLRELISEKVIYIEGDILFQKRRIRKNAVFIDKSFTRGTLERRRLLSILHGRFAKQTLTVVMASTAFRLHARCDRERGVRAHRCCAEPMEAARPVNRRR